MPTPKKTTGFEFLEHTADVYIAAYGKDLAEAFENAALAMFETMTDTKDVKPTNEKAVEAKGADKQALFYNWLEQLLIKFEVEGILLSKFRIQKIQQTEAGFKLEAKAYGEPYDPKRHKQKVGVKAVTYHRMEVDEAPGKVTLKFILDI
jgi:SHS2 domain-containing protein